MHQASSQPSSFEVEIVRGEPIEVSIEAMAKRHKQLALMDPRTWLEGQANFISKECNALNALKEEYQALIHQPGEERKKGVPAEVELRTLLRRLLFETESLYAVVAATDCVIKELADEYPHRFKGLNLSSTEKILIEDEETGESVIPMTEDLASMAKNLNEEARRYQRLLEGKPKA